MLGDAKLRGDSSPNKPITFGSRYSRYSFKVDNSQGSVAKSTILVAILKGHLSIGFQASAKCCGSLQENERKRRSAAGAVAGLQFQYLVS